MTAQRPVQNFSRKCALVATADERAMSALAMTLPKLGMSVDRLSIDETTPSLDAGRHMLFIDGDLPSLRQLKLGDDGCGPSVPVIGMVGVEAPSRLRLLVDIGAAAFLSKPIHSGTIFSALYLAASQHGQRAAREAAINDLETRRRKRRHVIKAVTIMMRMEGLDDEAAFQRLRRQAMQARVPVETYCEYVVQRCTTQTDRDMQPAGRQALAD